MWFLTSSCPDLKKFLARLWPKCGLFCLFYSSVCLSSGTLSEVDLLTSEQMVDGFHQSWLRAGMRTFDEVP